MTLDHVMTKHVVTVGPDDTLAHVRELFEKHGFHHLVVVERGKVVGIISDRDLLRNVSPFLGKMSERPQDSFLLQRKVHQIMHRKLIAGTANMPVKDGVILLLAHRLNCMPIIDEHGHCVGVVTAHDLLRYLLECGLEPKCAVNRAA
jgi:acetoin utilization protein AcuB